MHAIDIVLIILIAAVCLLAVYLAVKRKKHGNSCCGDCSACNARKKKP